MKLNDLGLKYNTDKATECIVGDKKYVGHDYLRHYELFLKDFKQTEFEVVELGCYTGASINMWSEYFEKAEIIGVDLNSELKSIETNKIKFICSDATAEDLPAKIKDLAKYPIKLIIDDCSHAWGDQRRSFEMLFPMLNSGGYYIIEDLECGSGGAYATSYPPKVWDSQLFFDYALDRMRILRVSENRNPERFRPFFDEMPKYIQDIERSIDMSIIIPGAIIFKKK